MLRSNFPSRREARREEAVERQEHRAALSAAQQLARLDQRLGRGVGAQKERKRLQKLIQGA